MDNGSEKPVELSIRWSRGAQRAFLSSLTRINTQDPHTSHLVLQRVKRALAVLVLQPDLGTLVAGTPIRRFTVPKTGHLIDYQVQDSELLILRWMRTTRQRKV